MSEEMDEMPKSKASKEEAPVEEAPVEEAPDTTAPTDQQMTREEYDAIGKGKDYVPHNTDNTFTGEAPEEAPAES